MYHTGQPSAAGTSSGSEQPQLRLETAKSKCLCIVMINALLLAIFNYFSIVIIHMCSNYDKLSSMCRLYPVSMEYYDQLTWEITYLYHAKGYSDSPNF